MDNPYGRGLDTWNTSIMRSKTHRSCDQDSKARPKYSACKALHDAISMHDSGSRTSSTTFQDHVPAFSAAQLHGLLSCSHVSHSKGGGAHLFLCILECRKSLVRKLPIMLSRSFSAINEVWKLCSEAPSPSISISTLASLSVELGDAVDLWY